MLGDSVATNVDAIQARWTAEELPRRLNREGVATEAELRPSLARKGRSLDEERAAYRVRSLADALQARQTGKTGSRMTERQFLAALDAMRERFPVESILTARQVAEAAGDPQA